MVSSSYDIAAEVKDSVPITVLKNIHLAVSAPVFDYNGYFSEPVARAGSDLHLNLDIKTLSGLSALLNGQLSITSSQLNYRDIKNITLQPVKGVKWIGGDQVSSFSLFTKKMTYVTL